MSMATTSTPRPSPHGASQLLVPAALMAVVLLMVVPLPALLLDLLLSVDIGLAVVLLLTVGLRQQPVEFSVFPSLLLLLTLIRLSLNVASTRLILLNGADGVDAAGHVIMAFGQFVVGGNFVVGVVVFLVLIAIQFIVINHGAVRISEVTARFTLDAMPGRQMAIDADLNAGVIDEREARARRERVRREADFYGAMDGAIRFTQRDALAALLITGVNIVAGLIIGVFQHGLDLATAAETYTILTVGEGLVTAIPALLVSMSGGLITTRAASESHLGEEVAVQLLRAIAAAGRGRRGARAARAHSRACRSCRSWSWRRCWAPPPTPVATRPGEAGRRPSRLPPPPDAADARAVDPLSIEIGYALVGLADEKQGGHAAQPAARASAARSPTRPGMVVPPVHVADNLQLGPRTYTIHVKGVEVARGELYARSPDGDQPGHGGAAGRRVPDARAGVRPARVVDSAVDAASRPRPTATRWSIRRRRCRRTCRRSIRSFLPDLLTRQQTKEIVDRVGQSSPKLVEELVPKVVSLGDIQRVLRQLLRERVPVRDLVTILEAMADAAAGTKDRDLITEAVRTAIGRTICRPYQTERASCRPSACRRRSKTKLAGAMVRTDSGAVLALEPAAGTEARLAHGRSVSAAVAQPVLLCAPTLRPHLWRLFARALPHMGVISHSEVPPQVRVASVAVLD